MRRVGGIAACAAIVAAAAAAPGVAQQVPEVALEGPTASFSEGLGSIRGVRELSDGRLLISDGLGQALIVADLDAGTTDTIGSVGGGPREYQTPDGLWALPDGATLFMDLGNGRLTRIGSDLSFGETMPMAEIPEGPPSPGMFSSLLILMPRGVDRDGRIYIESRMRGPGGAPAESALVVRYDPDNESADTLGMVKLEDQKMTSSGGPDNQSVSIEPRPLTARDSWAVAWDGRVAVARSGDYHLEWLLPDGGIVTGPAAAYEPVPVRGADKEEWLKRRSSAIGIMVTADNGRMQTRFGRSFGGRGGDEPDADDYVWPEAKPPFSSVAVTRQGDAWVQRHRPAGDPAMFDVFDAEGTLKGRVILPEGRELLGFGEGAVYLMRHDEFDFAWLERYDLPGV